MAGNILPHAILKRIKAGGRLFVISGPSGCGKTTLCEGLLKKRLGLVRSVSVTTRRARGSERNKRDYIYIRPSDFQDMLRNGMLLEHARVFGNAYGTPRSFIEKVLKQGRDILLNIDVQGAAQIKRQSKDAVLIFILPPSMRELKKRLSGRMTDTKDQIRKRLAIARAELSAIYNYDYYVVNRRTEKAVDELRHIILATRHRIP
jgi:guanylate kinase